MKRKKWKKPLKKRNFLKLWSRMKKLNMRLLKSHNLRFQRHNQILLRQNLWKPRKNLRLRKQKRNRISKKKKMNEDFAILNE